MSGVRPAFLDVARRPRRGLRVILGLEIELREHLDHLAPDRPARGRPRRAPPRTSGSRSGCRPRRTAAIARMRSMATFSVGRSVGDGVGLADASRAPRRISSRGSTPPPPAAASRFRAGTQCAPAARGCVGRCSARHAAPARRGHAPPTTVASAIAPAKDRARRSIGRRANVRRIARRDRAGGANGHFTSFRRRSRARGSRARPPERVSSGLHDAAADLVQLHRFEQRLEVALAESLVALALDEFEEHRPELVLGEDLQQHACPRRRRSGCCAARARRAARRGRASACRRLRNTFRASSSSLTPAAVSESTVLYRSVDPIAMCWTPSP